MRDRGTAKQRTDPNEEKILVDAYGRRIMIDANGKKHYMNPTKGSQMRKDSKAPRGYAYYGGSEYEDMFMMVNGQPHLINDESLKLKLNPL